ncbi:MAG: PilZ domain-containing protein [Proteobacteria bacterium]|nr:PilZ domain-containing protein [Pseudomonadota bacterium]
MPEEGLNHRRHRRLPVKMNVRIATIDPERDPVSGKPYFRSSEETCANVSRGGAFVSTQEPVAPGRRLLLDIQIPNGPSVQAIGRVAWTRTTVTPSGIREESGIGVEFLGGSPEHFDALEDFIRRNTHRRRKRRSPPVPQPAPDGTA